MSGIPGARLARLALAAACVSILFDAPARAVGAAAGQVHFVNRTADAGLAQYSPTFSIVVSDIDNDGADDLFVGRHAQPPTLYLNRQLRFTPQPQALPIDKPADRHGYTFADFDNDGDKDFAVAGGGADGIGEGMVNQVYRNLLVETGRLEFVDVSADSDIGDAKGRTRHLLPLANPRGDKVDLYSTGLHQGRPGSRNLYAANHSTADRIVFKPDPGSSLYRDIESDGKDVFFDYDRDGLTDFLSVGHGQARLYRNDAGDFTRQPWDLDRVWGVISAVVADLDNDGFPDLYLGGGNGSTGSDHVVANDRELHFVIAAQQGDNVDRAAFRMASDRLEANLAEHVPSLGRRLTDASNIFIGRDRVNPAQRRFQTGEHRAAGAPGDTTRPGTYLWYEKQSDLWHLLWRHDAGHPLGAKGMLRGEGMALVETQRLETLAARESRDYIAMNRAGKDWALLELDDLKHQQWTNHLTAADFNNDGWIDVAGVQTGEDGEANGDPFIVVNHGQWRFSRQAALQNQEDDIFRADLIVHGFFNGDGLPDLFYTNGFGLLPSDVGPYQLWLNATDTRHGYLLLELEGSAANRDAIGAQVELYDMDDTLLGYRELGSNFGRGQNTHKLHFGLGAAKGPFSLRIRWPGTRDWQSLLVAGNGFHRIRQR